VIAPLTALDRLRELRRLARGTAELAFMLSAQGWALLARAWWRQRREWR
jgi:hypothetical protein